MVRVHLSVVTTLATAMQASAAAWGRQAGSSRRVSRGQCSRRDRPPNADSSPASLLQAGSPHCSERTALPTNNQPTSNYQTIAETIQLKGVVNITN